MTDLQNRLAFIENTIEKTRKEFIEKGHSPEEMANVLCELSRNVEYLVKIVKLHLKTGET